MKTILSLVILLGACSNSALADKKDYYIIKFGATWCPPCKKMKASWQDAKVKTIVKQYKNGVLYDVDVDKDPNAAVKYGVVSVPTVIITDTKGNIVKRGMGYMTAAQLKKFLDDPEVAEAAQTQVFGEIITIRALVVLLARIILRILG